MADECTVFTSGLCHEVACMQVSAEQEATSAQHAALACPHSAGPTPRQHACRPSCRCGEVEWEQQHSVGSHCDAC